MLVLVSFVAKWLSDVACCFFVFSCFFDFDMSEWLIGYMNSLRNERNGRRISRMAGNGPKYAQSDFMIPNWFIVPRWSEH